VVRKIAQPIDPSTEFFLERPHTIRIRQEKQRAVSCSIAICQLQPTAACRSARSFASPILRPASAVVRVTDRGPRVCGRVLDLSLGAARSLGDHGSWGGPSSR
jgi:Lytic transglycolase